MWLCFGAKVTPDLHLTYSKNGGNLGLVLNDKKWKFLHKVICCGDLLNVARPCDSNRLPKHVTFTELMVIMQTFSKNLVYCKDFMGTELCTLCTQ